MAGFINVTSLTDPRGRIIRLDYEWEGEPVAEISKILAYDLIHGAGIEVGDTIQIGPFNLKVIEDGMIRDVFKVVRTDILFWRLIYLWHRYSKSLDIAYRRFIITLAIWNLAEYNPATVPYWRDIYFIKWIRSKFNG